MKMIDIESVILREIRRSKKEFGKNPEYVYLGWKELNHIKLQSRYGRGNLEADTLDGKTRGRIYGLWIYEVDAENHLRVS